MQTSIANSQVMAASEKILNILKGSDPFVAGKALECAKILLDCYIHEKEAAEFENQLRN